MKKYLFIILFSLICFIPFSVSATEIIPTNALLLEANLTTEQVNEYVNLALNSDVYLDNKETYPYYLIFYLDGNNFNITTTPTTPKNKLLLLLSDTIPTLSIYSDRITFNKNHFDLVYAYDFSNSTWSSVSLSSSEIYFLNFYRYGDYKDILSYTNVIRLDSYLDFNFEITVNLNLVIFDRSGNELGSIPKGTNMLDFLSSYRNRTEDDSDISTDDILGAEDTLYSVSKKLLGSLPIEFQFLYSVVALLLGVILILVIISPFILLIRWLI